MLFEIYILAWLVCALIAGIWLSVVDPRAGSFTNAFLAILIGMLAPPLLIIALLITIYEALSKRRYYSANHIL